MNDKWWWRCYKTGFFWTLTIQCGDIGDDADDDDQNHDDDDERDNNDHDDHDHDHD